MTPYKVTHKKENLLSTILMLIYVSLIHSHENFTVLVFFLFTFIFTGFVLVINKSECKKKGNIL